MNIVNNNIHIRDGLILWYRDRSKLGYYIDDLRSIGILKGKLKGIRCQMRAGMGTINNFDGFSMKIDICPKCRGITTAGSPFSIKEEFFH